MSNVNRLRFDRALMHPVTIAALVTLIVNDLLFKALWPGSWATGKISDLAWMVFAPPLLAYLLGLAAPRQPGWDRAVFIAAYGGLPLLYLAYNSWAPLHDAIMGVFMLSHRVGGMASPFDPTDSLVIPVGMAVALWVWRYGSVTRVDAAAQGQLLVAVLASFAMVATTNISYQGITRVGIVEGGTDVIAGSDTTPADWGGDEYVSSDGGWNWRSSAFAGANWGSETVATPRGVYRLDGPRILHSADGQNWTESYSVEHLLTEGNSWIFDKSTHRFHSPSPSLNFRNLVYHEPSGNVIVAWGLQGVLVNTESGQWHEVAVDWYSPIDFSFAGKSQALLTDFGFLFTLFALSLATTALALTLAQFRLGDGMPPVRSPESVRKVRLPGKLALAVAGIVILFFALDTIFFSLGTIFSSRLFVFLLDYTPFILPLAVLALTVWFAFKPRGYRWRKAFAFAGIGILIVFLIPRLLGLGLFDIFYIPLFVPPLTVLALIVSFGFKPREHRGRKVFALACGIIALAGAAAAVWFFDSPDYSESPGTALLWLLGIVVAPFFSLSALIVSWRSFKHWLAIVLGFIGINLLIILSFSWWLHLGMTLVVAKVAAGTLAVLGAMSLAAYLRRIEAGEPYMPQPPVQSRSPTLPDGSEDAR